MSLRHSIANESTPVELEAAILRQEHRLYPLLKNFWNRDAYAGDDPRHDAIVSALLWRIVIALMPTAAVASVGLAGIAGLWLAWQANGLIAEQNQFFDQQNNHFDRQNKLIIEQFEASERTELLRALYDTTQPTLIEAVMGHQETPIATVRSRSEALRAFLELERKSNVRIDLTEVQLSGTDLQKIDFRGVVLTRAILSRADLYKSNLTEVFINRAILRNANLDEATLVSAELQGADLEGAYMTGDLTNADFSKAILRHARFEGACIIGAQFDGADLANTDFDYASVGNLDWIDKLTALEGRWKVKNFIPENWTVVDKGVNASPNLRYSVRRKRN